MREYSDILLKSHLRFVADQIFGTQVTLLRSLNSGPPKRRTAIQEIFDVHTSKLPPAALEAANLDGWLAFVLETDLIQINEEGLYRITELGSQFLSDYVHTGKVDDNTRGL